MATLATTKELRKMSAEELQRELSEKQMYVSKLQISMKMGTEKDTAKLRKERHYVERILTILRELKGAEKSPNMPTPALPKKAKSASTSTK